MLAEIWWLLVFGLSFSREIMADQPLATNFMSRVLRPHFITIERRYLASLLNETRHREVYFYGNHTNYDEDMAEGVVLSMIIMQTAAIVQLYIFCVLVFVNVYYSRLSRVHRFKAMLRKRDHAIAVQMINELRFSRLFRPTKKPTPEVRENEAMGS